MYSSTRVCRMIEEWTTCMRLLSWGDTRGRCLRIVFDSPRVWSSKASGLSSKTSCVWWKDCDYLRSRMKNIFYYFAKKHDTLRTNLFSNRNLDLSTLQNNSETTSSTFNKLMNPKSISETKYICSFIESAFSCCVW